ncbi:MAG: carboxyl transferase domain-containing protein [Nitriliruptoraceae bacterium]
MSATPPQIVADLADDGSLRPWNEGVTVHDPMRFTDRKPYTERLADARRTSGTDEAVWTGRATVAGTSCAIVASDFDFLAGTMGIAAGNRVCRAFDRARDERLPVIGLPSSGGTRMQEGTPAFVQMAAVAAAVRRHHAERLPYLVYLRDPITGGVLASWGSLGHVTFAEPGALIALTGPRVIESLTGEAFPEHVQTAENLYEHGIIDGVVGRSDMRDVFATALAVLAPARPDPPAAEILHLPEDAHVDPWEAVTRSRRVDRPGVRELFAACVTHTTRLSGDGQGGRDPGCIAAIARVQGIPAVVIAADRPPGERGARMTAAGYRTARRAMALADQLGLPLVTIIDTAGADISARSEEEGLAAEVARCLSELSALRVPTLSVLFGEGSGGGALALLPADRVIACEHAWLSPIQPEGASEILYRTTERAEELANSQAIASTDLRRHGIVDVVVPDRPQPGEEGAAFADRVAATAVAMLRDISLQDAETRIATRSQRWRAIADQFEETVPQ